MFSSPAVASNLVFVDSCSGNFYAIDTGRIRCSYNIKRDGDQTSFHSDPLVTDDLILIGTDAGKQGHVYAFERATGKVRWKYPAPAGAGDDVGVASDIVYGVAQADELFCLNRRTAASVGRSQNKFDRKKFTWSNSPGWKEGLSSFEAWTGSCTRSIRSQAKLVGKQTCLRRSVLPPSRTIASMSVLRTAVSIG